jgi:hypothetical protein
MNWSEKVEAQQKEIEELKKTLEKRLEELEGNS